MGLENSKNRDNSTPRMSKISGTTLFEVEEEKTDLNIFGLKQLEEIKIAEKHTPRMFEETIPPAELKEQEEKLPDDIHSSKLDKQSSV